MKVIDLKNVGNLIDQNILSINTYIMHDVCPRHFDESLLMIKNH